MFCLPFLYYYLLFTYFLVALRVVAAAQFEQLIVYNVWCVMWAAAVDHHGQVHHPTCLPSFSTSKVNHYYYFFFVFSFVVACTVCRVSCILCRASGLHLNLKPNSSRAFGTWTAMMKRRRRRRRRRHKRQIRFSNLLCGVCVCLCACAVRGGKTDSNIIFYQYRRRVSLAHNTSHRRMTHTHTARVWKKAEEKRSKLYVFMCAERVSRYR